MVLSTVDFSLPDVGRFRETIKQTAKNKNTKNKINKYFVKLLALFEFISRSFKMECVGYQRLLACVVSCLNFCSC